MGTMSFIKETVLNFCDRLCAHAEQSTGAKKKTWNKNDDISVCVEFIFDHSFYSIIGVKW